MLADLESLESLGAELGRRARSAGLLLVWRAQTRLVRRILVRDGRIESTAVSTSSGQGLQLATPAGHGVLGSRDDLRPEPALALFERLTAALRDAARVGVTGLAPAALEPTRGRAVPPAAALHDDVDLAATARRLIALEAEIRGRVPEVSVALSYRAEIDRWRIARSDGTDVLFAMPRCTLGCHATSTGAGARHGVSATLFDSRPGLPFDEAGAARFVARAIGAARLARTLPDAPAHPSGSFPLLIDYALAKGLAHEAFGHAAEADGYRSSVLARDGRFRSGDQVGTSHVSIIDEPIPDDHAWQPFSANGVPRQAARIVDHGRLLDGLSDPWSAGVGGVRLTGAERAESFRDAPQPRMSNIRIEVDGALPAPGTFEDYGPEEVRALLAAAGVLKRHPRVSYLTGYSGGQVNTATGDFVFNCKAIWVLDSRGIELCRPAIFSGSMFGALHAVREAFGPLQLDALGYCGKWGQSVPSSGGSHYFVMLEPDPRVRLGGA